MPWGELLLAAYLGGAAATWVRVLQEHLTGSGEYVAGLWRVGDPRVSLAVQSALWPLFTLLIVLYWAADRRVRRV